MALDALTDGQVVSVAIFRFLPNCFIGLPQMTEIILMDCITQIKETVFSGEVSDTLNKFVMLSLWYTMQIR